MSKNINGKYEYSALTPRSNKIVWAIAAMHCLAAVSFGYNTTITSPAMLPLSQYFGLAGGSDSSDSNTNTFMQSVIVSTILVGALIGALFSGAIADRFGRNKVLVVTEIIFTAGATVCALSVNVWMLVAGRFILGLAVGAASVTVPLMIGEIAPPEIRGEIGGLNQLGITIGILIAYVLGTAFTYLPSENWRVMLGFPVLFCVAHVVIAGVFVRVESPRWLITRNRISEATETLRWLRGVDNVEEEMAELQAAQEASGNAPSILQQVKMIGRPVRPLVIVVGLMFFQQITGINAVLYYLTTFFVNAGMNSDMANYMSIVIGAINVLMTIVSATLVDRAGRKPLLLGSLGGMTVGLTLIGVFTFLDDLPNNASGIGSVVFTIVFVVFFAIGMGAVPWCVIGEVFPSSTRALSVSIGLFVNWTTNLIVSLTYLSLIEATSMSVVFWGFAVLSVVSFVFVFFIVPETKGRSVEDIVKSME